MTLNTQQRELLTKMKNCKRFTIVRLELYNSKQTDLVSTALNALHLEQTQTSLEQAKAVCNLLMEMEQMGLVNLCYTPRITAYSDYEIYEKSSIFAQLCELAKQGAKKPGFLFDAARIRRGVATVTEKGRMLYLAK